MRTFYEHTNSNGTTRQIDASEAARLLAFYPLNYYSLAVHSAACVHGIGCHGCGRGVALGCDMVGGRVLQSSTCKLDDGTTKGCWLTAYAGSVATAKAIAAEWTAIAQERFARQTAA